jgi:biotin transport system substrate-specific component
MIREKALNRFDVIQGYVADWRMSLSRFQKLGLAMLLAVMTGLSAQIHIYLPFSPVPVTGQTFTVLLAGILLGGSWGAISQILYIALGLSGVPWFTHGIGGFASLVGPSGGYIIGFVLSAAFLGYCSDHFSSSRRFPVMLGLMVFANFLLIYIPGLIHLSVWMGHFTENTTSVSGLLMLGAVPFIPGDLVKIFLAAGFARIILSKKR